MTIGAPFPRQDGVAKVTGAARFAADLEWPGVVEGLLVPTPTGPGRVVELDLAAASRVPGVVRIFKPGELPSIGPLDHWAAGQATVPLMNDQVGHEGQPVALILADDRVAAAAAARLIGIRVEPAPVRVDLETSLQVGEEIQDWAPGRTAVGSVEQGLAEADLVVTARYATADRHHAALEPSVTVADWRGDGLEVVTSTQWVFGVRAALAQAFGLEAERVRVRSVFVGGGFGAKGSVWGHEILAAAAARAIGRPVRIVLPRSQTFTAHGHQPATVQDVTLGARRDGRLTAVRHLGWSAAARTDDYVEHATLGTRTMYACPNIETVDRIVRLDRPQPTFMRAPHEGPGMVGLEIAMDELAQALGLDPVELRIRNHADADPTSGKPFSSKELLACYRLGAERFGWAERPAVPGTRREGGRLVGMGMASALMSTFRFGASARVSLHRDGSVLVESAAHEIGTGVGTILPQIVAEHLGVEPERVRVALADTTLPEAGGTFGSATTMGVGSAVRDAALKLKARLDTLAGEPGLEAREYPDLLALHRLDRVSEEGSWAPRRQDAAWAMNAYGAVFVEVRVDPRFPMPRVTRALGVYSAGRIINPITARSQAIGGMIWGIGQALLEESRVDPNTGRFVAKGFGGYRVPTHADVGAVEALFVPEFDPHASPLGARGVGEIGTIGIGAAVANAVFNATGLRVRRLPVDLIGRRPSS